MKPTDKRFLKIFGVLSISMAGFSIFVYLSMAFGPDAREVKLTVTVVDAATNAPVSDAIVVVRPQDWADPFVFLGTTNDQGVVEISESLKSAIATVGVDAWDPDMTKRGHTSLRTYLYALVHGGNLTDTEGHVHFYPNRHNFRIVLRELKDKERNMYMWQYENDSTRAEFTRQYLSGALNPKDSK